MNNKFIVKSTLAIMSLIFTAYFISVAKDNKGNYLPENPLEAARIFESSQCVRCHFIDFQHEGYGPDLGRIKLGSNMYDIVGKMWNAAPDMVSKMELIKTEFPKLTPYELSNLLAYLGVYQNYVVNFSREANSNNGKHLFQDKKCISCHSFNPESNTAGPSLNRFRGTRSPLEVLRAMWLHSYYMRKAGINMGIDWPKFTGGEIKDLLAFIVGGEQGSNYSPRHLQPGSPQNGKLLFSTYDCNKCHAVKGSGAKEAPDLGNILGDKNIDIYVILEAFWNHSPTMWETLKKKGKRIPNISTKDLADIIGYLFFINFDQSSGNKQQGKELFITKLCVNCHEPPQMIGNKMEILSRFWNTVPEMLQQAKQESIEWPTFSDGEMSSLIEYLSSIENQ